MPRTPPAPRLLFADGFGATAIDARGKVRARALPGTCFAFDAKSARLAVVGSGGALTLLDAALRSGPSVYHAPGALLPDGAPVHLSRREGAFGLDRGDAATWRALPAVPEALEVSLGPETQPPGFGFFVHTHLADDGGISLALGRDERLFGVLDPNDLTVRDPVRVRLRPSLGGARDFLPGTSWHVLVEHHRTTDTVTALSVAAGGAIRRCAFSALALPARDGHTLWAQPDDASVVQHTLDGLPLAALPIPAEHRGAGTVFVQQQRPWFVPWHGDVVIDLREGRVFDRALPGDPALRRHVAETLRRLRPLARAAGLGLHVASLHTRGGAKPFAQMSLWSDGGDLGTLAHCVQGAAMDWAKCAEVPAGEGLLSTGGSVTAAREADVRELLAALDALDAHAAAAARLGRSLGDDVPHARRAGLRRRGRGALRATAGRPDAAGGGAGRVCPRAPGDALRRGPLAAAPRGVRADPRGDVPGAALARGDGAAHRARRPPTHGPPRALSAAARGVAHRAALGYQRACPRIARASL